MNSLPGNRIINVHSLIIIPFQCCKRHESLLDISFNYALRSIKNVRNPNHRIKKGVRFSKKR